MEFMEGLGLTAVTKDHPAVFTVEDNKAFRGDLPGTHCKNLFLKDKKGRLWLVVTPEDRAVDLKALRPLIGAAHLSFGKAELLREVLGVDPGSVTPLAAINDPENRVTVVLDADLMTVDLLNFHPLENTATTAMSPQDLNRFLIAVGHPPVIAAMGR